MFDAWKQRQRQRLENRPERTVFYNIFATMMLVLAVELLMAVASILAINVTEQLDENAKDLLTMRVRNRASYVQEILRNAEDLEQLSDQITATTQQLLKSGDISLDTLDNSSEQSDALLVALAPQLLDTLRTKQVTGIFLILNTHDLDTCEVGKKMPGIYLRDMDPDARPSERNSDLLLERASATVVKELAIGTDKGWQPAFPYQGDTKGGILRTVFQTAYKSDAGLSAESYGRWTTNSYCLAGDDRHAIAYSMPLILPDGTVYGVVGVELLTEYLQTKLPFTELDEDKAGTYFIVTTTDDALTDGVLSLRKTVTSGEDLVTADAPLGVLNCRSNGNGGNWVELNDKRYYMVLEPLQVYNRNAPFAAEKWFLAGTMEQSVLLAFSSRVREVLLTTIAITLVLSVLGSLLVSARLARPINRLYREVIDAQEKKTFPRLSRTAIREVDRFAETITELNKELVTNSTKFLRIMDMASVEIGGYELRTDTGSVFVTDNFFSLLGKPEMQGEPLSVRRFEEVLKGIREKNPCDHTAEGDELLTIQQPDGVRYIMLRSTIEGHAKIGLADDEIVVNLQGDEPLMPLNVIRDVADLLASRPDCAMATAAHTIHDVESFFNPNVVKVVLDDRGTALTFSRAPIPWPRDHFRETKESLPEGFAPLRHLGLYAYRAGFLRRFPTLPQAPLEKLESLEQLRALYYGERIAVMVLDAALPAGVDTQKDLNRVRAIFEKSAPV